MGLKAQRYLSLAGATMLAFIMVGCQLPGAQPAPVTEFDPDAATPPADPGSGGGLPEPTTLGPIDVFATETASAAEAPAGADGGEIEGLPTTSSDVPGEGTPAESEATPDPLGTPSGAQPTEGTPAADGIPSPTLPGLPSSGETPGAQATPTVSQGTPVAQAGSDPNCPATHTVARGENLYRIALRYGLTTSQLANANGITNPNAIKVGQILRIPGCSGPPAGGGADGGAAPTAAPAGGSSTDILHTVAVGENLFRIALKYGTTWQQLAAYNGISDPTAIFVGQVIRVPQ